MTDDRPPFVPPYLEEELRKAVAEYIEPEGGQDSAGHQRPLHNKHED